MRKVSYTPLALALPWHWSGTTLVLPWYRSMPISFIDRIGRTHYRWWFRLIEINMKNPEPKSDAEIIAELQEKIKQYEARERASKLKDQDFLVKPSEPTGP